ncbi:RhoGAP domain-containing protein [Emericellopsis atlantica]|uniref:RhoGAP domain-containing protein n=1 Tax=Emericellopsis atlantica TaxID=2614577 RepID=A0A9P7ZN79_9HYPO|nr:RhoGAP domain-containing protein [Emericellopsis atlantica]KAG9255130.1 RhoGAP domain-containing protein [Emericellopsis atlantica]
MTAVDSYRQHGGRRTPDSGHRLKPTASGSSAGGPPPQWDSDHSRKSSERNRSRQRSGKRNASGQQRVCKRCGEVLTGQFVRALDGTFHLDCFKCRDCGDIVASKFFPVDDENGGGQYPLCETDYFRRLDLLCYQCGGALRGSYITALDRKYHVDHFTCSLCDTVFGAEDSYYEHDGNVYCHYHYSTQFAQQCSGCQIAILKQFVEIFRNGQDQHWHPECYMIHKFWNVRLGSPADAPPRSDTADAETRGLIRDVEERMEEKVFRIWSVLSTFEESSAACISDMLLHVSNGAYIDAVLVAKRFIWHVEILFHSTDRLDTTMFRVSEAGMSYGREAKLLCKKIVAFFSLLSKNQDTGTRKLGVTQELLSLVTSLAHYLKLLIRICLQGALKLERESQNSEGLYQFLDDLNDFDSARSDEGALQVTSGGMKLSASDSDHCTLCNRSVEDECARHGDLRWHLACADCCRCKRELGQNLGDALFSPFDRRLYCQNCGGGDNRRDALEPVEHVTKLTQYVFLLRVALARLLDILRSNGSIPQSEETALNGGGGNRAPGDRPALASDSRSKSFTGTDNKDHRRESSYENTLNDVRRLRSTRLDRHLSTTVRQARSSRVMDVDGHGPRPGSPSANAHRNQESTDRMFGGNDAINLDDLSRIVAVEQSRELQNERDRVQRLPDPTTPMGHQRTQSAGKDQDVRVPDPMPNSFTRRFFSELSALEYFNVRHLAVLTMQPMIEQEFSLDELLSFIESKKQPTFWKNLGKAFKNDKNKNVKKKGTFGVPLEMIIERDGAESTDGVGPGTLRIPAVVDDIIASMRKMDLSVEGVFRKNGNIKKQQELVERINNEGCETINFMDQPVIQLAAMLKRYLRDLPDPLMTHKLYRLWISAAKIEDYDKRKHCLHLTCCLLPKSHRDVLEILFSFMKWAGSFHQLDEELGSKMDIRNLATVIAPNILTNPAKASMLDGEAIYVIDAVETMISNIEEMCQVPDEILTLLFDQSLFASPGEITTKEILRRYQDRKGQIADINEIHNRPDNSSRPPPRRVETDPALWSGEASVRHVQEPPMAYGQSPQGTPPKGRWRGPSEPGPMKQEFNHSDSQLSSAEHSQRREWRNSGWGRHNNGLGVSGNS